MSNFVLGLFCEKHKVVNKPVKNTHKDINLQHKDEHTHFYSACCGSSKNKLAMRVRKDES